MKGYFFYSVTNWLATFMLAVEPDGSTQLDYYIFILLFPYKLYQPGYFAGEFVILYLLLQLSYYYCYNLNIIVLMSIYLYI